MIILKIIAGLLFYGGFAIIAINYGWKLPLAIVMIVLGISFQIQINIAER